MSSLEKQERRLYRPRGEVARNVRAILNSEAAAGWVCGFSLVVAASLLQYFGQDWEGEVVFALAIFVAGLVLMNRSRFVWLNIARDSYREIGGIPGVSALSSGMLSRRFASVATYREMHSGGLRHRLFYTVYALPRESGHALELWRIGMAPSTNDKTSPERIRIEGERLAEDLGLPFHDFTNDSFKLVPPPPEVQIPNEGFLKITPRPGSQTNCESFAIRLGEKTFSYGIIQSSTVRWLFNCTVPEIRDLYLSRKHERAPIRLCLIVSGSPQPIFFDGDISEAVVFWVHDWIQLKLASHPKTSVETY